MKKQDFDAPDGVASAAERLAETDRIYQKIRQAIDVMTEQLGQPDHTTPKDILSKINELNSAHLKVLIAQDAFHEKIGKTADDDAVDFDAIRADIGRRLDRIRDSLVASGISIDLD